MLSGINLKFLCKIKLIAAQITAKQTIDADADATVVHKQFTIHTTLPFVRNSNLEKKFVAANKTDVPNMEVNPSGTTGNRQWEMMRYKILLLQAVIRCLALFNVLIKRKKKKTIRTEIKWNRETIFDEHECSGHHRIDTFDTF